MSHNEDLKLNIIFEGHISSQKFEHILAHNYARSFKYNKIDIVFDLRLVSWFDIFELSLISIWIKELSESNSNVIVILPENKLCYSFLDRYKFIDIIRGDGIQLHNYSDPAKYRSVVSDLSSPYFPLTYLTEKKFAGVLNDLYYGDRLSIVLNDIKNTTMVKSGAIRDVILKELGDNVFIHGEGRLANIIMTKFGSLNSDKAKFWSQFIIKNTSVFEKKFFEKLRGKPYLSLVISDKGEGIYNSIISSYKTDTILNQKNDNKCSVLDYSLLYHSSSRTAEQRLGALKKVYTSEAREYPPPTGLFRLKEIVRELSGLLYLRSGESIICYDFYTDKTAKHAVYSNMSAGYKKLAKFGGTQYKVYLPTELDEDNSQISLYFRNMPDTVSVIITYDYHLLTDFTNLTVTNPDYESKAILDFLKKIDKMQLESTAKIACLILDFAYANISDKAICYILIEIMNRISVNYRYLCINIDNNRILPLNSMFEFKQVSLTKPLPIIDKKYNIHLFGVSTEMARYFDYSLDKSITQSKFIQDFCRSNSHLYNYNSSNDRYEFIYNIESIIARTLSGVKKLLNLIILEQNNLIYHAHKRVLLPSGGYCHGYFETFKLLENEYWKTLVADWLKYKILENKPSYIISISGHVGKFIDDIFSGDISKSVVHEKNT